MSTSRAPVVLDRADGLREGRLLSDVLVAEHPLSEFARLVGVTDGGVNVAPTFAQKREILANAVTLFRRLGYARPKVACLCAVETVIGGGQITVQIGQLQAAMQQCLAAAATSDAATQA